MVLVLDAPEQIPFRECSYVPSCPADDGDRRILMVLHFLQSLTEGVVLIDVGHLALWSQENNMFIFSLLFHIVIFIILQWSEWGMNNFLNFVKFIQAGEKMLP